MTTIRADRDMRYKIQINSGHNDLWKDWGEPKGQNLTEDEAAELVQKLYREKKKMNEDPDEIFRKVGGKSPVHCPYEFRYVPIQTTSVKRSKSLLEMKRNGEI